MSEYDIIWLASGSGIGLVIASTLYSIGGRAKKIIRRLGGALVLALTVNIISGFKGIWTGQLLLILPLLFAGFSMGYGADFVPMKILRRTLYMLGVCASGAIFIWSFGGNAWWVFIPHIGIGAWSIYLGVRNPIDAAAEEFFISMLLNLGLCMYPFIA